MHKSTIISKYGFLGPFAHTLKVRDLGSQDRKQKTKVLSVREIMVEIHSKMPVLEMKELKNKNKEDLE